MKQNKTLITALILLVITSALYRLVPGRPAGFAPQIAMALFAGAVVSDRKWAFALPLFSMLLSDALFQVLFLRGMVPTPGFYEGQWLNYMLIAGITVIGMRARGLSVTNIAMGAIGSPVVYFLLSNFYVWLSGGGYSRPKTFSGMIQCYADGLPFLKGYLAGTLFFSALLFGAWHLLQRGLAAKMQKAAA